MRSFYKIITLVLLLCSVLMVSSCSSVNSKDESLKVNNKNAVEAIVEDANYCDQEALENEDEEEADEEYDVIVEGDYSVGIYPIYTSDAFSLSAEIPRSPNGFLASDPLYFYITNHSGSQIELAAFVKYSTASKDIWDINGLVIEPNEQKEFSSYIDEDLIVDEAVVSFKVQTASGMVEDSYTLSFVDEM